MPFVIHKRRADEHSDFGSPQHELSNFVQTKLEGWSL